MNSFLFVSLSCLLSAVVFTLLARAFFFIVSVEGQSMSPTLVGGDRLLALRFWPARWLRQGQIVVTRYPDRHLQQDLEVLSQQKYIKRITGLPGDTVRVEWPNFPRPAEPDELPQPRRWRIPPGHYFVQGDSWGLDSTIVGPLPFHALCGVALMKLRPRSMIGGSQVTIAGKKE
jgi:signal peptidase I